MGSIQELHAYTYTVCVSGSYDPPGQLVPPEAVPIVSVPRWPSSLLTVGGVKEGRRRYIHVPQRMVDQLKVPFALSGLQVHADEAFSEEIVSRPMPAVEIAGWRFYRQVDESKLLVHGNLRPHAGVAGVFRRAFFPGVVAKLAFLGNGVENPEPFAGAHVESAHVAFVVAHALRSHSFAEGRADNHRG